MEKQETEIKWKLEMETGNGTGYGNGNEKCTNHWCNVFFIVCLVIRYSCIVLSNGYRTGFMSPVLCLYSCSVLSDYTAFMSSAYVASNVAI